MIAMVTAIQKTAAELTVEPGILPARTSLHADDACRRKSCVSVDAMQARTRSSLCGLD